MRCDPVTLGVGEVLRNRTTQRAVLGDENIRESLVAALLGELLPLVELLARLRGPTRHHHSTDVGRLEHTESRVGEEVGAFDQFDLET